MGDRGAAIEVPGCVDGDHLEGMFARPQALVGLRRGAGREGLVVELAAELRARLVGAEGEGRLPRFGLDQLFTGDRLRCLGVSGRGRRRIERLGEPQGQVALFVFGSADDESIGRPGGGGKVQLAAAGAGTVRARAVVVGRDRRQRAQRRARVDAEEAVEIAAAGVEADRAGAGCRPVEPDRCAPFHSPAGKRIADLPGGAARALAEEEIGLAGQLLRVAKVVVRGWHRRHPEFEEVAAHLARFQGRRRFRQSRSDTSFPRWP